MKMSYWKITWIGNHEKDVDLVFLNQISLHDFTNSTRRETWTVRFPEVQKI